MQLPYITAVSKSLLLLSLFTVSAFAQDDPVKTQSRSGGEKSASAKTRSKEKTKSAEPAPKAKAEAKRPVQPTDYAQWERLSSSQFSKDGRWLLYTISRVDETRTLHLANVKAKKKKSEAATFKQGERPVFSDDSKWLAVTIGKSPAELRKARKAGSNAPPAGGKKILLRNLKSGVVSEFTNLKGLNFSADSRYAAIEVLPKPAPKPSSGAPPKPGSRGGADNVLIIRELSTGADTTLGNVARHAWSDKGSLLAMVIDSPGISNALQLFNPASGVLRTLETSDQEYSSLLWREDAMDLAVMRQMKHGEKEDVSHVLLAWRDLDQSESTKQVFEHNESDAFPKDMYIASGGLEWSENGEAIYCDLKKWEKKPKTEPEKKPAEEPEKKTSKKKRKKKSRQKAETKPTEPAKKQPADKKMPAGAPGSADAKKPAEPGKDEKKAPAKKEPAKKSLRDTLETDPNVEVWHAKDVEIMPRQKKEAATKKNPKRRAVWWTKDGQFVQLANELTEEIQILRSGIHAVGEDETPHERTAMFGPSLSDLYVIDTRTGERERVLEKVKYWLSASPDGRYLLFLKEGHIWSHEIAGGKQRNLTRKLKTRFTNQQDDSLAIEKSPYGRGEWLVDGSAVLLYDRFDIWLIAPDGSRATKLTDGSKKMIRHRLSRASYHADDDGFLNPARPLYLGLYGERTKKTGYARLSLGRGAKKPGKPEVLLWDDKQFASLTQAEDANIYSFTVESYRDSPELHVAGQKLDHPRKIATTNAFQEKFLWGRSELVDFENDHGVKLQGSLTYPADYEPGKKYPMIVYIYEKRSQYLHRYMIPSEKSPYNPAVFSAEGYFVFQPDIVYRPQEPGVSALECVIPAVKAVIATGKVDEKRIGLMGHSWGAYQTCFIVTHSDLFAAGVAGAPLTDMMSMSVSVYWNSGNTNARIFAQSQGRMDKPFWRDVDTFVRNSPIHGIDDLKTPLLVTFGDKDGAVDWDQGIQMYNAARLARKENFVMLIYPGENHGLRKEENMVDYHYRVREWMDTHLKKEEAPKWITEGKSFLEREREKEEKKEKKASPQKPASKPPPKPEPKKTESPKESGKKPAEKKPDVKKEAEPEKIEKNPEGGRKKRKRGRKKPTAPTGG